MESDIKGFILQLSSRKYARLSCLRFCVETQPLRIYNLKLSFESPRSKYPIGYQAVSRYYPTDKGEYSQHVFALNSILIEALLNTGCEQHPQGCMPDYTAFPCFCFANIASKQKLLVMSERIGKAREKRIRHFSERIHSPLFFKNMLYVSPEP